MLNKSLVAAAAVAVTVAGLSATSAQAGTKVHVDLGLGLYGVGYGHGYPVYDDYDYGYGYSGHHGHHGGGGSWGVSCGEAKWEVKNANFHKVKTLDCSGKTFTFSGWKHGDKYRIKVGRKHGQIISVSEVY
jgi:hypothetical protein